MSTDHELSLQSRSQMTINQLNVPVTLPFRSFLLGCHRPFSNKRGIFRGKTTNPCRVSSDLIYFLFSLPYSTTDRSPGSPEETKGGAH